MSQYISGGRRRCFLLLSVLIAVTVSGGSLREMQTDRISQVINSNKVVACFLRSLPVPYRTDTAYIFIIDPMRAPRIEGGINAFIYYLRKGGVKSDIITLVITSRKRAAEKYLQRKNFTADYNLVVNKGYESFLKSFVFNRGDFGVPFVAKFSVKTGQLLSSYSLGGTIDSASVAWFISDTTKPVAQRPVSADLPSVRVKTDPFMLRCERLLKLLSDDEHPISTSYWVSVAPSGRWLAFNDKLTNFIYIFDLNSGKLANVLHPDKSEYMLFCSSAPEHVYHFMNQSNMAMYLGHCFFDDSTLLISASLPKVVPVIWEGDSEYGFYNMPVFIKKGVHDNNKLLNYVVIQSLPDTVPGSVLHSQPSFLLQAGLIFLPYSRGWPRGNQTLSEKIIPRENPFTDEFYRQPLYLFAAYRPSGEFSGFWGQLNARVQRLRLGYYWPGIKLAKFLDGKFYLSDGCSEKIYVYNQETSLIDSIEIFNAPPLVLPQVDRLKEPELYLSEAFKLNFRAEIKDFLVTSNWCYVLVLWNKNQPIVYKVGLSDPKTYKYALPIRYIGKEAKYYLLRETPSGVSVVSLLESSDETWYGEFKLP